MGAQWKTAIKLATSAGKGKIFSKLAKEIMIAARGGPDPSMNARLRAAVEAAKKASMPRDTLERAIKKGAGLLDETINYETVTYEGFAPHRVPVIVECLTDNKNRTAGEVRSAFAKNGGNLGETNSVSNSWKRVGEIRFPQAAASEDAMLEAAIEAGCDDCVVEGEHHVITCEMNTLAVAAQDLSKKFGDPAAAKFVWRTDIAIPVEGDSAETLLKLIDLLDDLDDVQDVYSNEDISEEELTRLSQ
jgi:YebC/PmpR family DNA-binding regulatory protein